MCATSELLDLFHHAEKTEPVRDSGLATVRKHFWLLVPFKPVGVVEGVEDIWHSCNKNVELEIVAGIDRKASNRLYSMP